MGPDKQKLFLIAPNVELHSWKLWQLFSVFMLYYFGELLLIFFIPYFIPRGIRAFHSFLKLLVFFSIFHGNKISFS